MNRLLTAGVAIAIASTSSIVTQSAPALATTPLAIIVDRADDTPGDCTTNDPTTATCTLRAAVELANAHPGSSIFLMPLTYTLGGAITISGDGTTMSGAATSPNTRAANFVIDAAGGKALVIDADDVTVRGVTITGAVAANSSGSAVLVKRNVARFVLSSSTIVGNTARDGAGLDIDSNASATIVGSTFAGNVATRKGGGIRVDGTLEVVNSTFNDNTAQSGGAISVAGSAAISFSTFVDNTSNNQKGGGVDRNGGNLFITGSILTRANQQSADGSDCSGNPNLVGVNYVGNAQGCQPGVGTLVGTVVGMVGIGGLTESGGPTPTMPLTADSVAIDRANTAQCRAIGLDGVLDTNDPLVTTDQRGLARPAGEGCDLGAYEVTDLDLGLTLTSSTATPFVGARFLPSSAISGSVIATDALFDGTLAASPLSAFPLESAPLSAFPLSAFPLSAFPLSSFPLSAFFTAAAPLSAFPLSAFPLSAFPLSAFPLSDLVLTDGSWDDLLEGTRFAGAPLQSLTLGDVSDVPAVGAIDVADLNLEGTPLSAFPLSAFLLGSTPLSAFPLSAFPAAGDWCDLVSDFCTAGGVVPTDPSFTLASLALAGVPLSAFPLSAFPLSAFPLSAFPLSAFPLSAFPLSAFAWQASPLSSFPLSAFPLSAFDAKTVIDCGQFPDFTCDGKTLNDAVAADAFVAGATLGALGDLFLAHPDVVAALGDYSLADLLAGMIPAESVPWEQIDLTVPGLQNAGPPAEWTFQYLAELTLTAPAATVDVAVTIPPGFAYVPGGASLDGAPIADPILSCPNGSCTDVAGEPTTITLAFSLADVPAGAATLEIDTRAGFELGEFTATANATASATPAGDPVVAGPSSTTVTVIAPDQAPDVPVFIETNGTCSADGTGDVNLGWVASSTDDIDLYRFDVSAEAAACGARADIFLSNLPVDLDVVLYSALQQPLRGDSVESIPYLDDVVLDLNPFDDVIQADTVQDIQQVLQAVGTSSDDYAVAAISSNRDRNDEHIRTGTLREGAYFIQVSGYNGAEANTPYALRVRTDGTVARGPCDALPYPGVDAVPEIEPLPLPPIDATLADNLNTLFVVNSQLLEFTYDSTQADLVLAAANAVAAADGAGVVGAVLPVDADAAVRAAYEARAADPCDPERSNDVVRAIGNVLDAYTAARPGIEYVVIVGDDRQVPMANLVDHANFANERTFDQDFAATPNNESIAALAAGRYRTDDPYGTDAGIRVRDHELFVPDRAVGRLVETPAEIVSALNNFVSFGGQLDPETEQRVALQTGYEFLTDGAALNASNLASAGYTVDDSLINDLWTDTDLVTALETGASGQHLDVVGIHAHFDENNALPARDNFNPPLTPDSLFDTGELPDSVDRAVVYSMGCHSGYSVSDVQIGHPAADWAQEFADGRTNVFAGNTGYGYGDTDRVALTEKLTAIFADEVGQDGSIGAAWTDAKQRMASEFIVLDAYQEKSLQQFVLYGLPMFHVGTPPPDLSAAATPAAAIQPQVAGSSPDVDPVTGQPIAELVFRRMLSPSDPSVPQFDLVTQPDGSYYEIDGRTLTVNGHPIQPLYAADAPTFDGLRARDVLITEMTTVDAPGPFDPLFFWASPNFGGPRPEYGDGSFPAEMATVRPYRLDGVEHEQVLVAGGQYRGSDDDPDIGTQRLHTRVVTQVYYSSSNDVVAPAISRSSGQFDDDAIQFDIRVDATAERVYVLYRGSGANVWSGVDLVDFGGGTWRGVGPFNPAVPNPDVEYIVQAVDDNGNVAISNAKSRYFLASVPGDVSDLALIASGDLTNGWYRGSVEVAAIGGGDFVEYRIDAGPFTNYTSSITLSDTGTPTYPVSTGTHIVTAFDETGAFAAVTLNIDSFGPTVTVDRSPPGPWSSGPVTITLSADDGDGSGVGLIEYSVDGSPFAVYTAPFDLVADGEASISARATDIAGNTGPITQADVRIDTVAPTVSIAADPAEFWSNVPVTIEVAANDSGSGVDTIEYSIDGVSFEPYLGPVELGDDGVVVVTARATDVAGNVGVADGDDAIVVRIDQTAPVVPTLEVSDSVPVGQAITADYACTDVIPDVETPDVQISGIDTCVLEVAEPGGIFVVADADPSGGVGVSLPSTLLGTHTVRVTAVDLAGNSTTRTETYDVIDDTPPVPALSISRQVVEMPQTNAATFSCTDVGSGIASCVLTVVDPTGTQVLTANGSGVDTVVPLPVNRLGQYSVTVTATDNGGNTVTEQQTYTVVDTTPPTVSISVAKQSVTIGMTNTATFACSDSGSGVSTCIVAVTAPDGSVTTISSGVNSGTIPVPVTTAGTYSVSVSASDVAGRTATATATYRTRLCVTENYDSTQSKQIGSNYTIKIELCDANGKNISSKNIVLTAVSVTGSDGISFPPGPNDSGNANDGFTFRFAQKGYIYNLDTTGFPFIPPGSYTLDFTTAPVPDPSNRPPSLGSARFTLRM